MNDIKLVSWNVRGLNSKYKRSLVLQYLKSLNPHIVLLQETHLMGSKTLSLNRNWIQRAVHSTYSSYARGVVILLHKKLQCNIEHVVTDPHGRYAIVVLTVDSQLLAIANVYIPPPFNKEVLYLVLEKIATFGPLKLLVAGDFNNVLDYGLDASNPNRARNLDLRHWADVAAVEELWRWKHPGERGYSYLSHVSSSSSRIDLAFANPALLPQVTDVDYLAGGLSDHTPLQVTLSRPGGGWSETLEAAPGMGG